MAEALLLSGIASPELGPSQCVFGILQVLWHQCTLASSGFNMFAASIPPAAAPAPIKVMHLINKGTSTAGQGCEDQRPLCANVEEPDFVGFQADLEILKQQLSRGEQRRSVISIVGMGGQGKTTLARKLYQSDVVEGHFDSCVWISASQVYGVTELLKAIMKKCMGTSSENIDAVELHNKIAKGKGIWWCWMTYGLVKRGNILRMHFTNTSNGSRVLLTTRNEDVALHADPTLKKAFLGLEANFPIDSQQLREEILSKCQGLHLATFSYSRGAKNQGSGRIS